MTAPVPSLLRARPGSAPAAAPGPPAAPGSPSLAPGSPTMAPGSLGLASGYPGAAPGIAGMAPGFPGVAPGRPGVSGTAGVPGSPGADPGALWADRVAGPVFAGRDRELAGLAGLLARASAGAPQVALIEGEAGMGKSALAAEFLARHREVPVLAASGDAAERGLAFGLIRQLTGRVSGVPPARLPLLTAGPDSAAHPLSVGAELLELIAAWSAASGLIVVAEDLQWADPPSAQALLFALRRLAGHRVLVVLSARPHGLRQLGESWARLAVTGRRCSRMALTGLDRAELARLAGLLGRGGLSRRTLDRIADFSGGNPLFAGALLAELPDRVLDGPAGPGGPAGPAGGLYVPASVSSVILPRLSALPSEARELVSAVAVLGGSCGMAAAAALIGLARPDRALDDAAAAGFLVAAAGGRQVRFADELTRQVVYGDIGTARRRSLHRWAASVSDGPEALAHAVAAASGLDEQLAARLDAAATAAADRGEAGQAARQLAQAAELGGRPQRPERLLAALELFVSAADAAGGQPLQPLVERLPPGARRDAALGQLALLRGRTAEGQALLAAAWVAGCDRASAAEAAASLAVCYGNARMLPECRTWTVRSAEAVPWAAPAAGRAGVARCLQALARALSGDAAAALGLLGRLPDPAALVPAAQAGELTIRGVLRLWTGDLAGADDDLSACAGLLSDGRPLRFPGTALSYLAETEFRLGRWDDAAAHAELAVSLAEEAGRASDLPLARSVAGQIAAVRGDWEQARAQLTAAEQAARRAGTGAAIAVAGSALSLLGFARDDAAGVLSGTARIMAMPGIQSYDDPAASWWWPMRIWALLRTGRPTEATAALAAFEASAAERPGADLAAVHCARLRAAIALSRGDQPRAQRVLDQASAAAGRLPMSLPRVLFDLERARCLARGRNRPAALARLRSAHQALVELGARPFALAAQAELAALGLRDRPAADGSFPSGSGLTAQELQVAKLVAAGLSNRETAARLYLSPKTIEYHLARIFAKLGVRTRYELAARLQPEGSEREAARPAVTAGDQPGQGGDGDLRRRP
jgi:DNA-binding CsgD family transcriptional regulator